MQWAELLSLDVLGMCAWENSLFSNFVDVCCVCEWRDTLAFLFENPFVSLVGFLGSDVLCYSHTLALSLSHLLSLCKMNICERNILSSWDSINNCMAHFRYAIAQAPYFDDLNKNNIAIQPHIVFSLLLFDNTVCNRNAWFTTANRRLVSYTWHF